jgi:hypothetical protein
LLLLDGGGGKPYILTRMLQKYFGTMKKIRLPFAWFCLVFFPLFYSVENHNHRFNLSDFKVYYMAAQNLAAHKPVYHQVFGEGSGFYKYSPVVLLVFLPFTLLPYFYAASLYFAVLSIFVFLAVKKAGMPGGVLTSSKIPGTVPYLLLLIAGAHIFRELHMGNVNAVLLYFCMVAVGLLAGGKAVASGVLLGTVMLFKPHFVVLVPLLLIFKRPVSLIAVLSTIAAGVGLPALRFGLHGTIGLHKEWLSAMMDHNAPGELILAPNTLQHLVSAVVPTTFPGIDALVTVAGFLVLYAALFFLMRGDVTDEEKKTGMVLSFFACIAAIPNLTFTDTEHFLLLLPLIGFVLANFSGLPSGLKALAVIAFVMYGGNWFDVWGRTLSDAMGRAGVLGIGNALVIGVALTGWTRIRVSTPASG